MNFVVSYVEYEKLDSPNPSVRVKDVIRKVKNNKGPSIIEFYKNGSGSFLGLIVQGFNNFMESCSTPSNCKTAIIFPVYKNGDKNTVSNYRGLSFIDTVLKFL